MRLVISTVAILSLICTLYSCARGGNVDKGHNGHIGRDHEKSDVITTYEDDHHRDGIITDRNDDIFPRERRDYNDDGAITDRNGMNDNGAIIGDGERSLDGLEPKTLIPEGIRR